jgi:hypothetical protein
MELIDEGETDHKIIVLREDDPNFDSVHSMADLERVKVIDVPSPILYGHDAIGNHDVI